MSSAPELQLRCSLLYWRRVWSVNKTS